MSINNSLEEKFEIGKSVISSYVSSALCFEYILANNKTTNPEGFDILIKIEQIAKDTIQILNIPENVNDMILMNKEFVEKIRFAMENDLL